jgi:hypothetical protein
VGLPLEGEPIFATTCDSDQDDARLLDWLRASGNLEVTAFLAALAGRLHDEEGSGE